MIEYNPTKLKLKNYSGLARLEVFELVIVTFPLLFVMPLRGYYVYGWRGVYITLIEYIKISALLAIMFAVTSIIVAAVISRYRVWKNGLFSKKLPPELESSIINIIEKVQICPSRRKTIHLMWNPSDNLMGAHVRGVFRPTIVISGGLCIGLMKENPKALAILAHEIAHIQHYDLVLPGFLGLAISDILLYPIFLVMNGIQQDASLLLLAGESSLLLAYKLIGLGAILALLFHSREYYADASASQLVINRSQYVSLLSDACRNKNDSLAFFHPTMQKRMAAVLADFPSIRTRWPLRAYLLYMAVFNAVLFYGFYQALDEVQLMFCYCYMWAAVGVIAVECFRVPILKSNLTFRIWTPGRRFFRYSIPPSCILSSALMQVLTENTFYSSLVLAIGFLTFTNSKEWSKQ